jgi:hypothetical protein
MKAAKRTVALVLAAPTVAFAQDNCANTEDQATMN